eukprot:TRINITY_DN24620_c0_g1_i1.p2 TRINITY_DN24620_c0_g1~~TRINITY_DN24620_c0_g1_i1.p2  ORF type:complete len:128 (-),score=67.45 TRINITY_DN24620_c0_g1_i1:166-549(-)
MEGHVIFVQQLFVNFFFFSSRRRHTRCREVSWARRCVQETGINAEYMGIEETKKKSKEIMDKKNKMENKQVSKQSTKEKEKEDLMRYRSEIHEMKEKNRYGKAKIQKDILAQKQEEAKKRKLSLIHI